MCRSYLSPHPQQWCCSSWLHIIDDDDPFLFLFLLFSRVLAFNSKLLSEECILCLSQLSNFVEVLAYHHIISGWIMSVLLGKEGRWLAAIYVQEMWFVSHWQCPCNWNSGGRSTQYFFKIPYFICAFITIYHAFRCQTLFKILFKSLKLFGNGTWKIYLDSDIMKLYW